MSKTYQAAPCTPQGPGSSAPMRLPSGFVGDSGGRWRLGTAVVVSERPRQARDGIRSPASRQNARSWKSHNVRGCCIGATVPASGPLRYDNCPLCENIQVPRAYRCTLQGTNQRAPRTEHESRTSRTVLRMRPDTVECVALEVTGPVRVDAQGAGSARRREAEGEC